MLCGLVAFTVATIACDPDPMLAPILGAPQPGCANDPTNRIKIAKIDYVMIIALASAGDLRRPCT